MLYIFLNNANWKGIRNRSLLVLLWAMQVMPGHSQLTQNNFYLNNEIRFERLAIENGLANNIAFAITQDKKGFIWIATLDGLIKYDGYTLTLFQKNPRDTNSLGDNIVMSVYEDHTGLIWVGTGGGGGVNSFNPQTGKWKRYPHDPQNVNSMCKGSVEGIVEDSRGMLWFGSTVGLARYNPKSDRFTVFENNPKDKYSLSNNYVFSVKEDKAGIIWIGTGGGLNFFDPKNERFYLIDGDFNGTPVLKGKSVHHIYEDKQGLFWLSSYGNGVFVIDPVSKKMKAYYYHDPKNPNSIGSNTMYAVTEDWNGYYWMSTLGGLYRFDPHTMGFTLYENESYLPKTETKGHCIMTDRAGLVWIGTLGRGAIHFSPQQRKFRRYLNDESAIPFGPGSNRIKSIFTSVDSQLYVATSQNLLKFNQRKDKLEELWQLKAIKKDNEDFVLTAACEEKPGVFWLGTDKAGIIRYDSYTGKTNFLQKDSADAESIANNWIDVLYKDRSGRLWVGTGGGDLQWYDSTVKKFIRYPYRLANEEKPLKAGIRFIYEDSHGDLWLGVKAFFLGLGGDGLYRIDRQTGNITHYKHQPAEQGSLSNNAVTCFYEDRKGIFWIGTYGGGLNKLDAVSGKITSYTKENGLLSNTVQGLAGDEAGNLWLKADEGITRFNTATLSTKQFGYADGLAVSALGVESDDYNAYQSIESEEGAIYFGSNNGITMFQPANIQENKFQPVVAITQFKVFDKNYPMTGKEISLDYNQNFFDVEFAALSYLSSGQNQYMYKLEGVDNNWVKSGNRRIARYTNVSPGEYTFRVKGSNNDAVWNEQDTALTIIIYPPWWRTWWAYSLYGLLVVASIWAFINYRSRNLVRQKRVLEEQVTTRTAEVVYQKEELQTAFVNLKATQAQLIQSEKMASLGELTAGIAHEIQNPLNFVNNFSDVNKELLEELKEEAEKGNIDEVKIIANNVIGNEEKISHHGKRAEAIVKGMLQHSRSSSGKKEPTDINKLADEYLRLAYHGLRAKDKSFNAELKTDYDSSIGLVNIIPQDMGRVILNLITNAFYAVGEKKKLLAVNYEPLVTVSTRKSADKVEIRVTDNGNGIPQNILDKIFQPFFTTKPTGQGTGLGLSLAYDIVKAHGGELAIETNNAEGAMFTILLPAKQEGK